MGYAFPTNAESRAFRNLIAAMMVILSGISPEEAVGSINRPRENVPITGPSDLIYHEDADFRAHTIYYGADCNWWLNPPNLTPPLCPRIACPGPADPERKASAP